MTKPTKWPVHPVKTQISPSDQSSLCAQWVVKDPSFLHVDSQDWSDAQPNLSLCWAHRSLCWFCHVMSHVPKWWVGDLSRLNYPYQLSNTCTCVLILKLQFCGLQVCSLGWGWGWAYSGASTSCFAHQKRFFMTFTILDIFTYLAYRWQNFQWLLLDISIYCYLSLVTRKPVFGVCDQVRLKPACSTNETS